MIEGCIDKFLRTHEIQCTNTRDSVYSYTQKILCTYIRFKLFVSIQIALCDKNHRETYIFIKYIGVYIIYYCNTYFYVKTK